MLSRYSLRVAAEIGGRLPGLGLFLFPFLLISPCQCQADVVTWSGGGASPDWTNNANWNSGTTPTGGDVAQFTSAFGQSRTPFLSTDQEIGAVQYMAGSASFLLDGPGTLTLKADILQGTLGIQVLSGAGDQSITAPLFLAQKQAWDVSGSLAVSGAVSGQGDAGITKLGPGALFLSSANTYPGVTWISKGSVIVGGNVSPNTAGPLGRASSAIVIEGSTSPTLLTGGAFTVGRDIRLQYGGGALGGATADVSIFSGNIVMAQNPNLLVSAAAGGNVKLTGTISAESGTPGVTVQGDGAVTLSGANSFRGTTEIQSGTLIIGNDAKKDESGSFLNGALGNTDSAVLLGGTSGVTDSALLIGGEYEVARNIEVRAGSTGTARLGGNADANSTFSGNMFLRKDLTVVQAPTTGQNQLTLSGSISASGSTRAVTFDNEGTVAVTGTLLGSNLALEKKNVGALHLNGPNTYTGGTKLMNGLLVLNANDALGSGNLQLSGGTLDANGFRAALLALVISGNSAIKLGGPSNKGELRFGSGAWSGGIMDILGWSGNAGSAGTDGRLFFTNEPSADFRGHIQFAGFAPGATWLPTGELVPEFSMVPEPTNIALAGFAAIFILLKLVTGLRK